MSPVRPATALAAPLARPSVRTVVRSAAVALGVVLAVTAVDQAVYWKPLKERSLVAARLADVQSRQPEVVLLGNSLLGEGVDGEALAALTGRRVEKMAFYGHCSALWYLVTKNLVARLEPPPRVVAVLFQRDLLTQPGLNVTGGYRRQIEKWMQPEEGEPLLDELAYRAQMNALEYGVLRHWRLFDQRERMKSKLEDAVKRGAAAPVVGFGRNLANGAIDRVFATEKMDRALLTARQRADDQAKEAAGDSFAAEVARSFLPALVALARERGYTLVFVRMQTRPGVVGSPEREAAKRRYAADLRAWLGERSVPMIDFMDDDRLTLDLYADGDHLNPERGRPVFTRMLAEALAPYLNEAAGGQTAVHP